MTIEDCKILADNFFTKAKIGEPVAMKASDYLEAMKAIDFLTKKIIELNLFMADIDVPYIHRKQIKDYLNDI